MRPRIAARLKLWLRLLLMAALFVAVFRFWLAPENVASWLLLSAFCT